MSERKPSGYWAYAGRVTRHLDERGMKWADIGSIWGVAHSTLYNSAYRSSGYRRKCTRFTPSSLSTERIILEKETTGSSDSRVGI